MPNRFTNIPAAVALLFAMMPLLPHCGAAQSGSRGVSILRVLGDQIVDKKGSPVMLRGIAFGNRVWSNDPLPLSHHDASDYQRVSELGMNTVRFYLNYKTFEDDENPKMYKPEGWTWLDNNIAWARQYGIYLVLNMHVPQGGYQSNNGGKALWEDPSAQDRLISLWRAIAERYRDEPVIAGYDFLNEPVVTKSKEQWQDLAERLVAEVRKVDAKHIFFVERMNAVDGDWREDEDRNFFLVKDPNVVYEFHFYKPFHFTHQGASWVDFAAEDTTYPDPNRVGVEWFLIDWKTASFQNPTLPEGDSDWTFYEGAPFSVTDPQWVVGKPTLACNANAGRAYFDDVTIEELNSDGSVKREVWKINLTTKRGWFFWKADGNGQSALEKEGHGDNSSLSISQTTGDTNLGAEIYQFPTEPDAIYRISGWMKGQGIPQGSKCQIRLDFSSSEVPLQKWDKSFLAAELSAYLSWGKKHGVPLFLGEFGAIASSYQQNRGGDRWTGDMLDLLLKNNLHFTYHDYHESSFGLYWSDSSLPNPSTVNQALETVFKEKLKSK